jgi:Mn2+/Fe2+ NRAMP family transporter
LPAITIGGVITILILLTGTMLDGSFDFKTISLTFREYLGEFGAYAFAAGLFAAGFSSSVTAPLAAAITAQSAVQKKHDPGKLSFRLTWAIVLGIGLGFSLINYHPVTLIIIAQAVNGLILPFVAVSVFLVLNDKSIVPGTYANGIMYNLITLVVIGLTIFLGIYYLMNVILGLVGFHEAVWISIAFSATVAIISVIVLGLLTYYGRNRS